MFALWPYRKSATAATIPLRSGQSIKRMAVFFIGNALSYDSRRLTILHPPLVRLSYQSPVPSPQSPVPSLTALLVAAEPRRAARRLAACRAVAGGASTFFRA